MGGAPEAALRPPGHLSHPQGQQASPAPTPSCPHPTEWGGGQSPAGEPGVSALPSAQHPGARCWDQVSPPWSGESLS